MVQASQSAPLGSQAGATAAMARWELYKLLSEPGRLRLLALTRVEELAVGELAELLGESQPNVSRHIATLRQAGVLSVRRQGTWALVRLDAAALGDVVIRDAVEAGRVLCERDGSLGRVADVVRARDRGTREFFARDGRSGAQPGPPQELAAYLAVLAPLMARRGLAVDAGSGDGRLLEVLAPVFAHVVAVDRSRAQLAACAERVAARGFGNVDLAEGDLDAAAVRRAVVRRQPEGADLVVAARVLHHAPRPRETVAHLVALARQGGVVAVLDYAPHEDEALRAHQADLWLGFAPDELTRWLYDAGAETVTLSKIAPLWCGGGPDRHIPWQLAVATVPARGATPTPTAKKKEARK